MADPRKRRLVRTAPPFDPDQVRASFVFDHAAIGMALVDLDGRSLAANQALVRILGYSAEELRSMVFTEFTHPEDKALDWKLYGELVAGKTDYYEVEKRYYRKDDALVWGKLTVSLVRDDAGAPLFAIATVFDVTEIHDARAELAASRARIVAAADESRRRLERDLHDGAQQRLISIALELRGVESLLPEGSDDVRMQLRRVGKEVARALNDLRETSRGIHPAVLSQGGLAPALQALARRSTVPVEVSVNVTRRLPERIEVAAYYVVSEALTNAAKHAHTSAVFVEAEATPPSPFARGGILTLSVRDDGVGGADPSIGSGLIGLADRIETLGGTMELRSPPGEGTSLQIKLPFGSD